MAAELPPLRPFLFRIAHNTAMDVLRRYERRHVDVVAEPPEDATVGEWSDPDVVHAALATIFNEPRRRGLSTFVSGHLFAHPCARDEKS